MLVKASTRKIQQHFPNEAHQHDEVDFLFCLFRSRGTRGYNVLRTHTCALKQTWPTYNSKGDTFTRRTNVIVIDLKQSSKQQASVWAAPPTKQQQETNIEDNRGIIRPIIHASSVYLMASQHSFVRALSRARSRALTRTHTQGGRGHAWLRSKA